MGKDTMSSSVHFKRPFKVNWGGENSEDPLSKATSRGEAPLEVLPFLSYTVNRVPPPDHDDSDERDNLQ